MASSREGTSATGSLDNNRPAPEAYACIPLPGESATTMAEMVDRCVIHARSPIENLPALHAEELASIGRSVTLRSDTTVGSETVTMLYEGLISFVTADCVSLIHCTRFEVAEYENHRHVVDHNDPRHALENDPFHDMIGGSMAASPPTAEDQVEHPLLAPTQVPSAEPGRVRELCTMGPLPCVTFSRKKIHDVHFAINPPASFFSLFQNPERRLFDMQCLRMLVRRYLVHTSQGNNPGGVSLEAFVAVRGHCPGIDVSLLESVAREEVVALVRADAKMEAERSSRRQRGRGDLQMFDGVNPFRALLLSTGVPRWTSGVGILTGCVAFFALAFALLFVYGVGLAHLLFVYINTFWHYFFMGAFLAVLAMGITTYHASCMAPPLKTQIYLSIGRAITTISMLSVAIVSVVKLIDAADADTFKKYFDADALEVDKCNFYTTFQCSGFDVTDLQFATETCKLSLTNMPYLFVPCRTSIMMRLATVLYPMVVAYVLLSGLAVADLALLGSMFIHLRRIDRTLRPALH